MSAASCPQERPRNYERGLRRSKQLLEGDKTYHTKEDLQGENGEGRINTQKSHRGGSNTQKTKKRRDLRPRPRSHISKATTKHENDARDKIQNIIF